MAVEKTTISHKKYISKCLLQYGIHLFSTQCVTLLSVIARCARLAAPEQMLPMETCDYDHLACQRTTDQAFPATACLFGQADIGPLWYYMQSDAYWFTDATMRQALPGSNWCKINRSITINTKLYSSISRLQNYIMVFNGFLVNGGTGSNGWLK